jgi:DNA-binding PadR family transcriptional regulator
MSRDITIEKYLPLSETTYYILLMLVEPLHGYAVMQEVEAMTEGTVIIGPGTLYGAFSTLEKEGLIAMVGREKRRKFYALTDRGKAVLSCQIKRLEMMTRNGQETLARFGDSILSSSEG